MTKKISTTPWDVTEHLETEEDMAAYLEAALEEDDPALVAAALGDIARAKGMAQIGRQEAGAYPQPVARFALLLLLDDGFGGFMTGSRSTLDDGFAAS